MNYYWNVTPMKSLCILAYNHFVFVWHIFFNLISKGKNANKNRNKTQFTINFLVNLFVYIEFSHKTFSLFSWNNFHFFNSCTLSFNYIIWSKTCSINCCLFSASVCLLVNWECYAIKFIHILLLNWIEFFCF